MPKNSLERKCDKEPLVFNTLHASTGQAPPQLLQIGHLGLQVFSFEKVEH